MNVPAVAELLDGTPKIGGTEEIDVIRGFVVAVRDSAETFTLLLQSAGEHLAHSQSDATSGLNVRLGDQLVPGGSALYLSSDDAARALAGYASTVGEIHTAADNAVWQAEENLEQIRSASGRIAVICAETGTPFVYLWNLPPSVRMPETAEPMLAAVSAESNVGSAIDTVRALWQRGEHEMVWRTAAREWEWAAAEVDRLRAQWNSLIEDRRTAEVTLQRALSGTPIGELIALAGMQGLPHVEILSARLSGRSAGRVWNGDGPRKSHPGLKKLIGSHDGSEVWSSPPNPEKVAEQWKAMGEAERDRLMEEVPWVIGNLPGIPFADRDRANRIMLEYYIVHQARLGSSAKQALAEVTRIVYGAEQEPPVSIVALELGDGVPLVAVGYGDLDEAEHVGWTVPGMYNDADDALVPWDRAARGQYEAQRRALRTGEMPTGRRAAVIAFLSYDTPNAVTVLGSESARVGGDRLAAELDGTFATRAANTPALRVGGSGHSYGTTVLTEAAARVECQLDYVTLVGSAGIDKGSAMSLSDINVRRDETGNPQVYTTIASSDLLARVGVGLSGRQLPNVSGPAIGLRMIDGAYSFSSEGHGELLGVEGHGITNANGSGYFDPQTVSNYSMAMIAVGRIQDVPGGLVFSGDSGAEPPE